MADDLVKRLKRRLGSAYRRLRYILSRYHPGRVAKTFAWAADIRRVTRDRRSEERLTVAVDICSFWEPLTGIGWYLYRLLESVASRDDIRVRLYGPDLASDADSPPPAVKIPEGPAVEWVRYPIPDDLTFPPWRLRRPVNFLRRRLMAADGNRVIFAPNYLVPPQFSRMRGAIVATVHDLGFHLVPHTLAEDTLEALVSRLEETFAHADHLITPSHRVRTEMAEAGFAEAETITAVHHGPGQLATVEAGERPSNIPETYALHVGTIEPRKNLKVLLEAWRILVDRGDSPPPLALCGRRGWKSEDLEELLDEGEREGWLLPVGYVDNPQLATLYRDARVVLFPTLYEGFGLPAIEAQQAGAPLLCSDIPVLREVADDGALYAPPEDPEIWAQRIHEVVHDDELRRRLSEAGRRNARRFSWEKAAEETVAVWQKVATK